MASSYIFEPILERGAKSGKLPSLVDNSRNWYRTQASKTIASPNRMLTSDRQRFRQYPMIGSMYLFAYDPKMKATLPYYDRFPLVIPFGSTTAVGRAYKQGGAGFYGLNMHYLPPILRAKLMDKLYMYASNKQLDESTRLRISYKLLSRAANLRFFKPCVKQYLFSHMRSKFFYIEPKEWDIALFLPLDRFVKADRSVVYKESREMIG